jgi:hypothetical protein
MVNPELFEVLLTGRGNFVAPSFLEKNFCFMQFISHHPGSWSHPE